MAAVASVGMIAALPFDPFGIVVSWVGPPIAIAGVLIAGAARGRRFAQTSVAPIVTRHVTGIGISGRW